MEYYKNLKEDKEFFPYEYGASRYSQTSDAILQLSVREELASNIDLIYTHMDENGVIFSSPGGSFKRKLIINLSHYMNYNIRQPRRGENLKKDDKMRQLLEPLAKILCTEKYNLEKFKKKIPNGFGEYEFSDGTSYKGEWKDGKYHGEGIFSDSAGDDKYKGKWKNGKMHGQGVRIYYDGVQERKLKGEFKDNSLHGLGSEKTKNWKRSGNWKNGKLHGQGTFKNLMGDKYEGRWKDGNMHGKGIQNYPDGSKYIGNFKEDKRWSGIQYNKNGKINVIFDNGVKK